MNILLVRFFETLLYPPMGPLLILVTGIFLLKKRPQIGRKIVIAGVSILYITSIPLTSQFMIDLLQSSHPTLPKSLIDAKVQAIVVVGGGRYYNAPEYDKATSAGSELVRLRYAAYLHRKTGLPIAAIDGDPFTDPSERLQVMQSVLQNDYGAQVRWTDERSKTTYENARFAREVLEPDRISRIALVTHAWHMPRAQWTFSRQGFEVTAAPTSFISPSPLDQGAGLFVPKVSAMVQTNLALHEFIGILWYRIRY